MTCRDSAGTATRSALGCGRNYLVIETIVCLACRLSRLILQTCSRNGKNLRVTASAKLPSLKSTRWLRSCTRMGITHSSRYFRNSLRNIVPSGFFEAKPRTVSALSTTQNLTTVFGTNTLARFLVLADWDRTALKRSPKLWPRRDGLDCYRSETTIVKQRLLLATFLTRQ